MDRTYQTPRKSTGGRSPIGKLALHHKPEVEVEEDPVEVQPKTKIEKDPEEVQQEVDVEEDPKEQPQLYDGNSTSARCNQ
jgi:hypothetical protein